MSVKFELNVKGQELQTEEVVKVDFSLKRNYDGSIGVIIENKSLKHGPQEFLRILYDGTVRRRAFDANTDSKSFLKTEKAWSPAYQSFSEFIRIINE